MPELDESLRYERVDVSLGVVVYAGAGLGSEAYAYSDSRTDTLRPIEEARRKEASVREDERSTLAGLLAVQLLVDGEF